MITRRPIRSPLQVPLPPAPKLGEGIESVLQLVHELRQHKDTLAGLIEQATSELARAKEIQKGEKGDTGESVYTYEDLQPYIERMAGIVHSLIPTPENGKDGEAGIDGKTPVLGIDYLTPEHEDQIVQKVAKKIGKPKDGETPIIDYATIASEVIEKIVNGKMLKTEHVNGLEETMSSYRNQLARGQGYVHGGGDTLKAASGYTLQRNSDGTTSLVLAGSTGTSIWNEVVNGSGTAFILAQIPLSGTLRLYANGQRLTLTVDYTLSGKNIMTLTSWATGTVLADYSY